MKRKEKALEVTILIILCKELLPEGGGSRGGGRRRREKKNQENKREGEEEREYRKKYPYNHFVFNAIYIFSFRTSRLAYFFSSSPFVFSDVFTPIPDSAAFDFIQPFAAASINKRGDPLFTAKNYKESGQRQEKM